MQISVKDLVDGAIILVIIIWLIWLITTSGIPVLYKEVDGIPEEELVLPWSVLAFFADEGWIRKLAPIAGGIAGLYISYTAKRHEDGWVGRVIDAACVVCFLLCIYLLYIVWNPNADNAKSIREIVTGDGTALTGNLKFVLGTLAAWIAGFIWTNQPIGGPPDEGGSPEGGLEGGPEGGDT